MTGQKLAQSFKLAFVLGGAECVWADLQSARCLCPPDIICCVNDIGIDYPGPIDYWVSYHLNKLILWEEERYKRRLSAARHLCTGNVRDRYTPKNVLKFKNTGGSSGLLATRFLMDKTDVTHIILCGVPLNPDMPHYHSGQNNKPWKEGRTFQKHWIDQAEVLKTKVRSMQGWTAELLGKPTKEWLES